jgi:YD repeat-containing protein
MNRAVVTWSIDPRGGRSSSPDATGDLVLFTEPRDAMVRYSWDGGERRSRRTVTVKGFFLPTTVEVTAEAPELRGRHTARVPIKADCITTVRFVFPERP